MSKMTPKGRELCEDLKKDIVQLHRSILAYNKISKRIHISVKKFKSTEFVRAKPRSGRPLLLTERDVRHIEQCIRKDRRRSASSLTQEVLTFSRKTVSAQIVHRSLNNNGHHGRVPRKKPLFNVKHKCSRFSYVKTYRNKERTFWYKIMLSDETKFNLFSSDGIKSVGRRHQKPITKVAPSLL
jgi:hypothetical protein